MADSNKPFLAARVTIDPGTLLEKLRKRGGPNDLMAVRHGLPNAASTTLNLLDAMHVAANVAADVDPLEAISHYGERRSADGTLDRPMREALGFLLQPLAGNAEAEDRFRKLSIDRYRTQERAEEAFKLAQSRLQSYQAPDRLQRAAANAVQTTERTQRFIQDFYPEYRDNQEFHQLIDNVLLLRGLAERQATAALPTTLAGGDAMPNAGGLSAREELSRLNDEENLDLNPHSAFAVDTGRDNELENLTQNDAASMQQKPGARSALQWRRDIEQVAAQAQSGQMPWDNQSHSDMLPFGPRSPLAGHDFPNTLSSEDRKHPDSPEVRAFMQVMSQYGVNSEELAPMLHLMGYHSFEDFGIIPVTQGRDAADFWNASSNDATGASPGMLVSTTEGQQKLIDREREAKNSAAGQRLSDALHVFNSPKVRSILQQAERLYHRQYDQARTEVNQGSTAEDEIDPDLLPGSSDIERPQFAGGSAIDNYSDYDINRFLEQQGVPEQMRAAGVNPAQDQALADMLEQHRQRIAAAKGLRRRPGEARPYNDFELNVGDYPVLLEQVHHFYANTPGSRSPGWEPGQDEVAGSSLWDVGRSAPTYGPLAGMTEEAAIGHILDRVNGAERASNRRLHEPIVLDRRNSGVQPMVTRDLDGHSQNIDLSPISALGYRWENKAIAEVRPLLEEGRTVEYALPAYLRAKKEQRRANVGMSRTYGPRFNDLGKQDGFVFGSTARQTFDTMTAIDKLFERTVKPYADPKERDRSIPLSHLDKGTGYSGVGGRDGFRQVVLQQLGLAGLTPGSVSRGARTFVEPANDEYDRIAAQREAKERRLARQQQAQEELEERLADSHRSRVAAGMAYQEILDKVDPRLPDVARGPRLAALGLRAQYQKAQAAEAAHRTLARVYARNSRELGRTNTDLAALPTPEMLPLQEDDAQRDTQAHKAQAMAKALETITHRGSRQQMGVALSMLLQLAMFPTLEKTTNYMKSAPHEETGEILPRLSRGTAIDMMVSHMGQSPMHTAAATNALLQLYREGSVSPNSFGQGKFPMISRSALTAGIQATIPESHDVLIPYVMGSRPFDSGSGRNFMKSLTPQQRVNLPQALLMTRTTGWSGSTPDIGYLQHASGLTPQADPGALVEALLAKGKHRTEGQQALLQQLSQQVAQAGQKRLQQNIQTWQDGKSHSYDALKKVVGARVGSALGWSRMRTLPEALDLWQAGAPKEGEDLLGPAQRAARNTGLQDVAEQINGWRAGRTRSLAEALGPELMGRLGIPAFSPGFEASLLNRNRTDAERSKLQTFTELARQKGVGDPVTNKIRAWQDDRRRPVQSVLGPYLLSLMGVKAPSQYMLIADTPSDVITPQQRSLYFAVEQEAKRDNGRRLDLEQSRPYSQQAQAQLQQIGQALLSDPSVRTAAEQQIAQHVMAAAQQNGLDVYSDALDTLNRLQAASQAVATTSWENAISDYALAAGPQGDDYRQILEQIDQYYRPDELDDQQGDDFMHFGLYTRAGQFQMLPEHPQEHALGQMERAISEGKSIKKHGLLLSWWDGLREPSLNPENGRLQYLVPQDPDLTAFDLAHRKTNLPTDFDEVTDGMVTPRHKGANSHLPYYKKAGVDPFLVPGAQRISRPGLPIRGSSILTHQPIFNRHDAVIDPLALDVSRNSGLGNPFSHRGYHGTTKTATREEAVGKYAIYAIQRMREDPTFAMAVGQTTGRPLLCACFPDLCHSMVLDWIANATVNVTDSRGESHRVPAIQHPELFWRSPLGEMLHGHLGQADHNKIAQMLTRYRDTLAIPALPEQAGTTVIRKTDPRYPRSLLERMGHQAPEALYAEGNLSLLNQPSVTFSGRRTASEKGDHEGISPEGLAAARAYATAAAQSGLVVISGNAIGSDAAAHQAAIDAGGKTIAVLPTAIGMQQLRFGGTPENSLVLSPFSEAESLESLGTDEHGKLIANPAFMSYGKRANMRNPIMAAMAGASIITESRLGEGGTRNFANEALSRGLPVYAVENGVGNADIIKAGAASLPLPAPVPTSELPSGFQSTALYPNRLADKANVEGRLGLLEAGNATTAFHTPGGQPFATGYNRVVYGDHGPYIEFNPAHITSDLQNKFQGPGKPDRYYDWQFPTGEPDVKVYRQLRDVHGLPNAPRRDDGLPSRFNRAEGYADYRPGMIYVSPDQLRIAGAGGMPQGLLQSPDFRQVLDTVMGNVPWVPNDTGHYMSHDQRMYGVDEATGVQRIKDSLQLPGLEGIIHGLTGTANDRAHRQSTLPYMPGTGFIGGLKNAHANVWDPKRRSTQAERDQVLAQRALNPLWSNPDLIPDEEDSEPNRRKAQYAAGAGHQKKILEGKRLLDDSPFPPDRELTDLPYDPNRVGGVTDVNNTGWFDYAKPHLTMGSGDPAIRIKSAERQAYIAQLLQQDPGMSWSDLAPYLREFDHPMQEMSAADLDKMTAENQAKQELRARQTAARDAVIAARTPAQQRAADQDFLFPWKAERMSEEAYQKRAQADMGRSWMIGDQTKIRRAQEERVNTIMRQKSGADQAAFINRVHEDAGAAWQSAVGRMGNVKDAHIAYDPFHQLSVYEQEHDRARGNQALAAELAEYYKTATPSILAPGNMLDRLSEAGPEQGFVMYGAQSGPHQAVSGANALGMTTEEFAQRHPRLFRQHLADPDVLGFAQNGASGLSPASMQAMAGKSMLHMDRDAGAFFAERYGKTPEGLLDRTELPLYAMYARGQRMSGEHEHPSRPWGENGPSPLDVPDDIDLTDEYLHPEMRTALGEGLGKDAAKSAAEQQRAMQSALLADALHNARPPSLGGLRMGSGFEAPVGMFPDPALMASFASGIRAQRQIGMKSNVHGLTFNDGSEGVVRQNQYGSPAAELLSHLTASVLGFDDVVPHGMTTAKGFLTRKVPGMTADDYDEQSLTGLAPLVSSQSGHRLGMFDYITGQQDRHPGNWMVRPDQRVMGIDHELAFEYGGTSSRFAKEWAQAPQSKQEWEEYRRRFAELEPEFKQAHARGGAWHKEALARIDHVLKTGQLGETLAMGSGDPSIPEGFDPKKHLGLSVDQINRLFGDGDPDAESAPDAETLRQWEEDTRLSEELYRQSGGGGSPPPPPPSSDNPGSPLGPIDRSILEAPEAYQAGLGWKMHLNVSRDLNHPLTKGIVDWLTQQNIMHKVGHDSGQEGKGMTVYLGNRDRAEDVARELHQQFGADLPAPGEDVLRDDQQFAGNVYGRFSLGRFNHPRTKEANGDDIFHAYGFHGTLHLLRDIGSMLWGQRDMLGMAQRGHETAARLFGEFYTGTRSSTIFDPSVIDQEGGGHTSADDPLTTTGQAAERGGVESEADYINRRINGEGRRAATTQMTPGEIVAHHRQFLNPKQLKMLMSHARIVLATGGGGNGKSHVLRLMIARWLHEGVDPREIVHMTFGNALKDSFSDALMGTVDPVTNELSGGLLGAHARGIKIGTRASFSKRLLRQFYDKLPEQGDLDAIRRGTATLGAHRAPLIQDPDTHEMVPDEQWDAHIVSEPEKIDFLLDAMRHNPHQAHMMRLSALDANDHRPWDFDLGDQADHAREVRKMGQHMSELISTFKGRYRLTPDLIEQLTQQNLKDMDLGHKTNPEEVKEAAGLWRQYEQHKATAYGENTPGFDMDDLSWLTNSMLEGRNNHANPNYRDLGQEIYNSVANTAKKMTIDEWPQLGSEDYPLISAMAAGADQVVVGGDHLQHIGHFRGALQIAHDHIRRILARVGEAITPEHDFEHIHLNQHYRGNATAVHLMNVVRSLKGLPLDYAVNKDGTPQGPGGEIYAREFANEGAQNRWIAEQVRDLIKEKGVAPKDISVLAGTNVSGNLARIRGHLKDMGVPIQLSQQEMDYRRYTTHRNAVNAGREVTAEELHHLSEMSKATGVNVGTIHKSQGREWKHVFAADNVIISGKKHGWMPTGGQVYGTPEERAEGVNLSALPLGRAIESFTPTYYLNGGDSKGNQVGYQPSPFLGHMATAVLSPQGRLLKQLNQYGSAPAMPMPDYIATGSGPMVYLDPSNQTSTIETTSPEETTTSTAEQSSDVGNQGGGTVQGGGAAQGGENGGWTASIAEILARQNPTDAHRLDARLARSGGQPNLMSMEATELIRNAPDEETAARIVSAVRAGHLPGHLQNQTPFQTSNQQRRSQQLQDLFNRRPPPDAVTSPQGLGSVPGMPGVPGQLQDMTGAGGRHIVINTEALQFLHQHIAAERARAHAAGELPNEQAWHGYGTVDSEGNHIISHFLPMEGTGTPSGFNMAPGALARAYASGELAPLMTIHSHDATRGAGAPEGAYFSDPSMNPAHPETTDTHFMQKYGEEVRRLTGIAHTFHGVVDADSLLGDGKSSFAFRHILTSEGGTAQTDAMGFQHVLQTIVGAPMHLMHMLSQPGSPDAQHPTRDPIPVLIEGASDEFKQLLTGGMSLPQLKASGLGPIVPPGATVSSSGESVSVTQTPSLNNNNGGGGNGGNGGGGGNSNGGGGQGGNGGGNGGGGQGGNGGGGNGGGGQGGNGGGGNGSGGNGGDDGNGGGGKIPAKPPGFGVRLMNAAGSLASVGWEASYAGSILQQGVQNELKSGPQYIRDIAQAANGLSGRMSQGDMVAMGQVAQQVASDSGHTIGLSEAAKAAAAVAHATGQAEPNSVSTVAMISQMLGIPVDQVAGASAGMAGIFGVGGSSGAMNDMAQMTFKAAGQNQLRFQQAQQAFSDIGPEAQVMFSGATAHDKAAQGLAMISEVTKNGINAQDAGRGLQAFSNFMYNPTAQQQLMYSYLQGRQANPNGSLEQQIMGGINSTANAAPEAFQFESQYLQQGLQLKQMGIQSAVSPTTGLTSLGAQAGISALQNQAQHIQLAKSQTDLDNQSKVLALQVDLLPKQQALTDLQLSQQGQVLGMQQQMLPLQQSQLQQSQALQTMQQGFQISNAQWTLHTQLPLEQAAQAVDYRNQQAQHDQSVAQLNYNVAYNQALYGPPGKDMSRVAGISMQENQLVAKQNPLLADIAAQPLPGVGVYGLENQKYMEGLQYQRQQLVYGRSPLMGDLQFASSMKHLDAQETFYKESQKLAADKFKQDYNWQQESLKRQQEQITATQDLGKANLTHSGVVAQQGIDVATASGALLKTTQDLDSRRLALSATQLANAQTDLTDQKAITALQQQSAQITLKAQQADQVYAQDILANNLAMQPLQDQYAKAQEDYLKAQVDALPLQAAALQAQQQAALKQIALQAPFQGGPKAITDYVKSLNLDTANMSDQAKMQVINTLGNGDKHAMGAIASILAADPKDLAALQKDIADTSNNPVKTGYSAIQAAGGFGDYLTNNGASDSGIMTYLKNQADINAIALKEENTTLGLLNSGVGDLIAKGAIGNSLLGGILVAVAPYALVSALLGKGGRGLLALAGKAVPRAATDIPEAVQGTTVLGTGSGAVADAPAAVAGAKAAAAGADAAPAAVAGAKGVATAVGDAAPGVAGAAKGLTPAEAVKAVEAAGIDAARAGKIVGVLADNGPLIAISAITSAIAVASAKTGDAKKRAALEGLFGTGGAVIGTTIGAGVGIETGPGALVTGALGGIAGGAGGRAVADRIADIMGWRPDGALPGRVAPGGTLPNVTLPTAPGMPDTALTLVVDNAAHAAAQANHQVAVAAAHQVTEDNGKAVAVTTTQHAVTLPKVVADSGKQLAQAHHLVALSVATQADLDNAAQAHATAQQYQQTLPDAISLGGPAMDQASQATLDQISANFDATNKKIASNWATLWQQTLPAIQSSTNYGPTDSGGGMDGKAPWLMPKNGSSAALLAQNSQMTQQIAPNIGKNLPGLDQNVYAAIANTAMADTNNPHMQGQDWINYCEKLAKTVLQQAGLTNSDATTISNSAADAARHYLAEGALQQGDIQKAKNGALLYFTGGPKGFGHVAIKVGDNMMVGSDLRGVGYEQISSFLANNSDLHYAGALYATTLGRSGVSGSAGAGFGGALVGPGVGGDSTYNPTSDNAAIAAAMQQVNAATAAPTDANGGISIVGNALTHKTKDPISFVDGSGDNNSGAVSYSAPFLSLANHQMLNLVHGQFTGVPKLAERSIAGTLTLPKTEAKGDTGKKLHIEIHNIDVKGDITPQQADAIGQMVIKAFHQAVKDEFGE